jgi:hypothetical protein
VCVLDRDKSGLRDKEKEFPNLVVNQMLFGDLQQGSYSCLGVERYNAITFQYTRPQGAVSMIVRDVDATGITALLYIRGRNAIERAIVLPLWLTPTSFCIGTINLVVD